MSEKILELGGNPGRILKAAREEAGLSLVQAAEALHLRGSVVDAIEREDYATFSSPIFLKGYFRSYCRLLKLHEERMLELLEKQLVSHYGAMDQARSEQDRVELVQARQRMVKKLALLFILLVGTVTLMFIGTTFMNRDNQTSEKVSDSPVMNEQSSQTVSSEPVEEAAAAIPEQEFAYTGSVDSPIEQGAVSSDVLADVNAEPRAEGDIADAETLAVTIVPPIVAVPPAVSEPAPVVMPEAAESAVVSPMTSSAGPDGSKSLSFTFASDCWVKLTDGKGKVIVAELKYAGDLFSLSAEAPVKLVLGNARAVTLNVDNQPYDLLQHTTQNGRAALVIQ